MVCSACRVRGPHLHLSAPAPGAPSAAPHMQGCSHPGRGILLVLLRGCRAVQSAPRGAGRGQPWLTCGRAACYWPRKLAGALLEHSMHCSRRKVSAVGSRVCRAARSARWAAELQIECWGMHVDTGAPSPSKICERRRGRDGSQVYLVVCPFAARGKCEHRPLIHHDALQRSEAALPPAHPLCQRLCSPGASYIA